MNPQNQSYKEMNEGGDQFKEIRVWCDGCYDFVHFGHSNAFRQAKELGIKEDPSIGEENVKVIVGLHSDEEIKMNKGAPPVFTEKERQMMIESIKWVDETVLSVPYNTKLETLEKYNCAFTAHGDDITVNAKGFDTYQEVKDAKKYKEYARTQGVSTTDLINRMINTQSSIEKDKDETQVISPYTGTQFLFDLNKIQQFLHVQKPLPGEKIIYCPGTFDVLHPGHLTFLKEVKSMFEKVYLIVGLYSDEEIKKYKLSNFIIMNLNERVYTIAACKFVSNIVIGAPVNISQEFIEHYKIDLVVCGKKSKKNVIDPNGIEIDLLAKAKELNIFKEIESGNEATTELVVQRIVNNKELYQKRNKDKEKKESEMIQSLEITRKNTEKMQIR